jgi:replicative DNA helicase
MSSIDLNDALPLRAAPHNIEAEQALLGAIFVNNAAHERVADFLEPSHFFDPLHQRIYETASKLIASGKQANPITLKSFFASLEPIDATLTVPQYLGRLAANAATIINARDYGRTIRDLAVRRQLILIGEDMANAAYDSPVDFPPGEQIAEAEQRLYALGEHGRDQRAEVDARDMHRLGMAALEKAYRNKGALTGLTTGLKDLDRILGGLQASDLIIVAGRPSMGKTALGINIAGAQNEPVHFFSQEMGLEQISWRMLADTTGITMERFRSGELDEEDWRELVDAERRLGERPLIVDPTGAMTISQLATRARRVQRKHGTKLLIVDYIQLMRGIGTQRTENRNLEVSQITGGLKALAKELNIPVIALSQLSRDVEKRADKRPQLADLRDSGSIEQDADIVMFVYRDEYYLERDRPTDANANDMPKWLDRMSKASKKAEVIVAKYRQGKTATVPVYFDAERTRFSDLAHSGQQPAPEQTTPAGRKIYSAFR